LQFCKNLRVVYLYNNKLKSISGLEFGVHITHLYLQNNNIESIGSSLSKLVALEKLYLDNNCIKVIEGLDKLSNLEELYISNQRIAEGEHMVLEPNSMIGIKSSLQIFCAGGNKIEDISPLAYCSNLVKVSLQRNDIVDVASVVSLVKANESLFELDLSLNPLTKLNRLYREQIVVQSHGALHVLDNVEISENERIFLTNLEQQRQKHHHFQQQQLMHQQITGSTNVVSLPPIDNTGSPNSNLNSNSVPQSRASSAKGRRSSAGVLYVDGLQYNK